MSFNKFLIHPLIESDNLTITVGTILIILIILVSTILVLRIVRKITNRIIVKRNLDKGTYWSIYLLIKYFIWVIIIILILDTGGVQISVLLASIAALLVGVGLGIQQLFGDIASGIVLLIERNLQINDVIQMDDGTVGRVIELGLRTSKLKTRDDIVVVVPNSNFVNNKIINWSHIDFKTRFKVDIGVAYGSDVELVTMQLLESVKENKRIPNTPKPFVRFNDFGESSLDFQLFFWVKESFYVENIKSDVRYSIDRRFRENDIQIPFPQRDVHIKK